MTIKALLRLRVRVRFKRIGRGILGMSYPSEKIVYMDFSKNTNHCKVFLHELIHCFAPDMSEKEVLRWESKLWRKTTSEQRLILYRKMVAGRRYENDE